LVSYNWNGFGLNPETWTILIVAVAIVVTMLMLAARKDVAYSLVVLWALIGIGVNHSVNQTVVTLIEMRVAIVAIAIIVTVSLSLLRRRKTAS
jgi:translocator protein